MKWETHVSSWKYIRKDSLLLGLTAYRMSQPVQSAAMNKAKIPNICKTKLELEWGEQLISPYLG